MFSRWAARPLTSLLARLPSQCEVCRAWPSRRVCDACVARFAPPAARCGSCALPVPEGVIRCGECVGDPPPLDACLAACTYAWPWPDCIAQFKFRGEAGWAGPLATLMRSVPWVEPALEQCDNVLPMPMAPARLRERGFNQALELARRPRPTPRCSCARATHRRRSASRARSAFETCAAPSRWSRCAPASSRAEASFWSTT
jgi:predicted amidophosphoribosyltransferase